MFSESRTYLKVCLSNLIQKCTINESLKQNGQQAFNYTDLFKDFHDEEDDVQCDFFLNEESAETILTL